MSDKVFLKLDELSKVTIVNLLNGVFQDYALRVHWSLESFDRDIAENNISLSSSFVMESAGEKVGIVLLSFTDKRAKIDLMGVLAQFRRSGVGFQMIDEVLRISKWRGCESIVLEVLKSDLRALSFYKKFGFKEKRDLITFFIRKACDKTYSLKPSEHNTIMEKAFMVNGKYKREPDWQREPANFPHLSLYNFDLIINEEKKELGYCIWVEKENAMYIVDLGPSKEASYEEAVQAVCAIARSRNLVALFPTVPENDPLYCASLQFEPEIALIQTEMVYKIH